jgi:hypothetical protein
MGDIGMSALNRITWLDIDVRQPDPTKEPVRIIDENGNILWNVMTNSLAHCDENTIAISEIIYQQPEFIHWIDIHTKMLNLPTTDSPTGIVSIADNRQPVGMWQLVFPDVTRYSLRTVNPDLPEQTFDPLKLQSIRTDNLTADVVIQDHLGNNINEKVLLVNNSGDKIRLKVYNKTIKKFYDL